MYILWRIFNKWYILSTGNEEHRYNINELEENSMALKWPMVIAYIVVQRSFMENGLNFVFVEAKYVLCLIWYYYLSRIFLKDDEEFVQFRRFIRIYNNQFALTTFSAKYDFKMTKNSRGVYTFKVQGQIFQHCQIFLLKMKSLWGFNYTFTIQILSYVKELRKTPVRKQNHKVDNEHFEKELIHSFFNTFTGCTMSWIKILA